MRALGQGTHERGGAQCEVRNQLNKLWVLVEEREYLHPCWQGFEELGKAHKMRVNIAALGKLSQDNRQ